VVLEDGPENGQKADGHQAYGRGLKVGPENTRRTDVFRGKATRQKDVLRTTATRRTDVQKDFKIKQETGHQNPDHDGYFSPLELPAVSQHTTKACSMTIILLLELLIALLLLLPQTKTRAHNITNLSRCLQIPHSYVRLLEICCCWSVDTRRSQCPLPVSTHEFVDFMNQALNGLRGKCMTRVSQGNSGPVSVFQSGRWRFNPRPSRCVLEQDT